MSRQPRMEFENAFYHVTARGNNRQKLFEQNEDFLRFLTELRYVAFKYGWICFAYCLMHNHYHMVISTPDSNLSLGMRQLHRVYSHYCREVFGYTGPVFEGRYDASGIYDDAYALETIRYDLNNPVKANLVSHPKDWRWSSYKETTGLEQPSGFVDNTWVRSLFDDNTLPAKRFMDFIDLGTR